MLTELLAPCRYAHWLTICLPLRFSPVTGSSIGLESLSLKLLHRQVFVRVETSTKFKKRLKWKGDSLPGSDTLVFAVPCFKGVFVNVFNDFACTNKIIFSSPQLPVFDNYSPNDVTCDCPIIIKAHQEPVFNRGVGHFPLSMNACLYTR